MAQVLQPQNNLLSPNENTGLLNQNNGYTSPLLEKVNHLKDDYEQKALDFYHQVLEYKEQARKKSFEHINVVKEKVNYYKSQAVEKGSLYTNVVLEKSKNYKVTQYTEEQLTNIVTFMEKQIKQLNQTYLQKSVSDENLSPEYAQEQSLIQRVTTLSLIINQLAYLTIQDQISNIKDLPVTKRGVVFYQQFMTNPRIREAVIFTSITQEFLSEIIQTKLLTPSITYFNSTSSLVKSQTSITIENVQTKMVKQYIPLIMKKYGTLKNSSVHIYSNCMTIDFAKEYYQTNQQLIQQEIQDLYTSFIKYSEITKEKCTKTYSNALQSYKQRRSERIAYYESPTDNNSSTAETSTRNSETSEKKNE